MATDTADAPTIRRLWQMPTFLLGAAAFAAVWQGWVPLNGPDPATEFRRDLAALRTACEKLSPDAAELDELLKKIARTSEAYPELGVQAHFALGSGYVRLAEITAAPEQARTHWQLARQHFDQIRTEQLTEQLTDPADPPRFAFRSASFARRSASCRFCAISISLCTSIDCSVRRRAARAICAFSL